MALVSDAAGLFADLGRHAAFTASGLEGRTISRGGLNQRQGNQENGRGGNSDDLWQAGHGVVSRQVNRANSDRINGDKHDTS